MASVTDSRNGFTHGFVPPIQAWPHWKGFTMDSVTVSPTVSAGRWTLNGFARQYSWPQCRYCGCAQNHDCKAVACLACGSIQCHMNGSGRGTCSVCYHGYLPDWYRSEDARTCGYRDCGNDAVSQAPRIRRVCADHLTRATVSTYNGGGRGGRTVITLADYIAQRVAHRDSGKGWEHWRWVA